MKNVTANWRKNEARLATVFDMLLQLSVVRIENAMRLSKTCWKLLACMQQGLSDRVGLKAALTQERSNKHAVEDVSSKARIFLYCPRGK